MNRIYLSGIVMDEPMKVDTPVGTIYTFPLANENGTYRINAASPCVTTGDEIRISGRLAQRSLRMNGNEFLCTEINSDEIETCYGDECGLYPALASVFEATIYQKLLAVLFIALLARFTGDD